jgi:DNA polymerase-3 subunit gamma/tau
MNLGIVINYKYSKNYFKHFSFSYIIILMLDNWQTLYNKYRPKNFKELVGQKEIVTILENSLKKNYIHHGIIFTGIRGVGKTSISIIFSAAMNCEERLKLINNNETITNEQIKNIPCGVCENCKICFSGEAEDILQIDGATHTGVDSIRLIIEDTMFMPKILKYKIIIIDEVHMLSKSAFNSILKTLENPPKNVKFIFCTTEKQKILDTIISRCLLLELKKIGPLDLYERLKSISNKEKIIIDDESIKLVVNYSEGSLRDALSILENLYLLTLNEPINRQIIEDHLRIMNDENILLIYTYCLDGNWQKAREEWEKYYFKGYVPFEFLKKLSKLLCNLLKAKIGNEDNKELFENILNNYDLTNSIIIGHWQICLYAIKNIYYSEESLVDMVLIMMTLMEENMSFEEIQKIFPGIKLIH